MRLALHLLGGLVTVLARFPFAALPARRAMRQRWSRRLLDILGIELRSAGAPLEAGAMLVANHVSWIDIFVINALVPAAFVSKAEVRKWPAIGWLSANNDTIFLQRGSRGHARVVGGQITDMLESGGTVALFPEGTTTDGSQVLHFHGALLQPAIDAGCPIQPVALRYRTPTGAFCRAPAYDGDLSLLQCIAHIIAEPAIVADVELLPARRPAADSDRRALANALQAEIAASVASTPR